MKKKVFLSFAALTAAFTMNAQSKLPRFNEPVEISKPQEFMLPTKTRAVTKTGDYSAYYKANHDVHADEIAALLTAKGGLQVQIDAAGNKGPLVMPKTQMRSYEVKARTYPTGVNHPKEGQPYWNKVAQGLPITSPVTLTQIGFYAQATNGATSNVLVSVYDKTFTNKLATTTVSVGTFAYKTAVFSTPVSTSDSVLVVFEMSAANNQFGLGYTYSYFKSLPKFDLSAFYTGVTNPNFDYNATIPFAGDGLIFSGTPNTSGADGTSLEYLLREKFDFFVYPYFNYDLNMPYTASKTSITEGESVDFSTPANNLALNPLLNFMEWNKIAKGVDPAYTYLTSSKGDTIFSDKFNASITFPTAGSYTVKAKGITAPWSAADFLEDSTVINITVTSKCVKPAVPTFTGAAAVCVGATINLTPSATGGTWTSSAATKATVTAGAVKGIAAGTATISYTVGTTGCSTTGTKVITVEAAPAVTISGPAKICWNGRTMMRASVAGGVWGVENSALLLASPQGLFRNSVKPTTDNFKSGVNYTVTSKLGACSAKVVKAVYVRNVTAPNITVTAAPSATVKVNATVTATATTNITAVGTWSTTNTLVSATANTNTKTAAVKGLKVGTGANVVYFADDAATGCRQAGYLAFNVTAAASMVDANQGSISSTTGVSVYPNPSNGVVTFENIAGAKSISLVDMTGRTVKTVAVNADRMTVNFSGVQNGKYLVQVAGENVNEVRSIVIE